MPRFTIRLDIEAPRKLTREESFREVIREQLIEVIPENVYFEDEDGNEHELSVEVVD